ncbi:MAG: sensor histidine kinase [Bryobacteraceae bacterium]
MLRRIWGFINPQEAESDQGFAQEILSLSALGLRITAGAEIIVPLVMMAAQYLALRNSEALYIYLYQGIAIVAIGILTLAASRLDWTYERSRAVCLLSVYAAGVVLVTAGLFIVVAVPGTGHYIPGRITGLMMLVVAVMPLTPWQTLALGASIGGYYMAALEFFRRVHGLGNSELDAYDHVFMAVITLIASALTAVVYQQRAANYRSYITALRASMDLRRAQSQMLLAENGASMGRLAAALSHELNTPLGVLRSAVSTLPGLATRVSAADAEQRERLLALQQELFRSMISSVDRLREIVGRMQRYTNLDRAEVQVTDIASLLRDVVALHSRLFEGKVQVELRFAAVPPLSCRPQLLSAVFTSLLNNAVEACTPGSGNVVLITRQRDHEAEILIQDNGRGLAPRELSAIFDPGFRVHHGKVGTGNWSLFGARQIVNEHGGDIRIDSQEGKGTTVTVNLPLPVRTTTHFRKAELAG